MNDTADLVVVGAGIVGTGTALEAARRGLSVVVVEQGPLPNPAAASTGPSRKMRSTYENDGYSRLVIEAMAAWDDLEREAGEALFLRRGNLVYTVGDAHPTLDVFQAASERAGGSIERLDTAALRARFPLFRRARTAIFERDAGILRATAATSAIRGAAVRAGARFLERTGVARLDLDGGRPVVALPGGRRIEGERLVVAAGAWSSRLIPALDSVVTLKRQGIAYLHGLPATIDVGSIPPFSELETVFYGFPAIGSDPVKLGWHQYGEVTTDPDTDRDVASTPFLDGIRGFLDEHWGVDPTTLRIEEGTCLYDLTPANDFLIDFLPGSSTVLVATGTSGHGFKFGSVFGRVVMDRLDGTGQSWIPEFAWAHATRLPTQGEPQVGRSGI